jgi:hypothetical protein
VLERASNEVRQRNGQTTRRLRLEMHEVQNFDIPSEMEQFLITAKLPLFRLMMIIYHWAFETVADITSERTKISKQTITNLYLRLRLLAVKAFNSKQQKLAWHNCILLPIDESKRIRPPVSDEHYLHDAKNRKCICHSSIAKNTRLSCFNCSSD